MNQGTKRMILQTVPVGHLILKLAADSILLILGIFHLLASSGNPEENRK